MSLPVERHPAVLQDIVECADYIANGNVRAAMRFVDEVERTISLIQQMPGIGGLKAFTDARLENVRVCVLRKFRKYLIVYIVEAERIRILAVLHGMRDYPKILRRRG